ncbi:MAG: tetratricopeptide repeat protein [Candidatus Binatia bacterium]
MYKFGGTVPACALLVLLSSLPQILQAQTLFQARDSDGYLGARACAECHRPEFDAWHGSQHDRAMQVAALESVLGRFDDARFRYAGVESRFYRKDGRFMVRTDGPDGKLHDYAIAYTFGVEPLQQYLIEFPGGRLQALGIAWDSRPRRQGGQRWFHLYPEQRVDSKHPLHWTRLRQTWNHQCAECHSTGVKKHYDPMTHRYTTTWQAIDVTCEACHGSGARHVQWARKGAEQEDDGLVVHLDSGHGAHWSIDPETGKPKRSSSRPRRIEIEVCARCHARRSLLSEEYKPGQLLTQTHRPALLSEGLYYPDGQTQGEVYVYGSFLQSRMYRAGVTCSDCHDPHTAKLRLGGNAVCLQCHLANRFASPEHHHHAPGSRGSACVACHMPARTYMVVDPRRDHSLRIPRPDLSERIGTPNSCNGCHPDRDTRWARGQLRKWFGTEPTGFQHFAEALYQGRRDGPGASDLLNHLARDTTQPAIARASALALLPRYRGRQSFASLQQALKSPDALMRMAAVGALESLPAQLRAALLMPLLRDPQRAVRIEAARVLADLPQGEIGSSALGAALTEYRAALELNRDRPETLLNLANLERRQGHLDAARKALREALRLEPDFAPAYANLADLQRSTGNEKASLETLLAGLRAAPDSAVLHHGLGLAGIRAKELDAALPSLRRAAELAPDDPRYVFVLAVALHDAGRKAEAIRVLEAALPAHPTHRDLLFTLIRYHLEAGDTDRARELAARFRRTWPGDARSRQLKEERTRGSKRARATVATSSSLCRPAARAVPPRWRCTSQR